jgi:hypothetical protein
MGNDNNGNALCVYTFPQTKAPSYLVTDKAINAHGVIAARFHRAQRATKKGTQ